MKNKLNNSKYSHIIRRKKNKFMPDDVCILANIIRVLLPDSANFDYTQIKKIMQSNYFINFEIPESKVCELLTKDGAGIFQRHFHSDKQALFEVRIDYDLFMNDDFKQVKSSYEGSKSVLITEKHYLH